MCYYLLGRIRGREGEGPSEDEQETATKETKRGANKFEGGIKLESFEKGRDKSGKKQVMISIVGG